MLSPLSLSQPKQLAFKGRFEIQDAELAKELVKGYGKTDQPACAITLRYDESELNISRTYTRVYTGEDAKNLISPLKLYKQALDGNVVETIYSLKKYIVQMIGFNNDPKQITVIEIAEPVL